MLSLCVYNDLYGHNIGLITASKYCLCWAVVVSQLVERSLLTPEFRGSNPVIGKLLYGTFVYFQLY